MSAIPPRVLEHVFFFGLLLFVGYFVWQILTPFLTSLVLAMVIATVCYPFYTSLKRQFGLKRDGVAAFVATSLIFVMVVLPFATIGYLLFLEAASFYTSLSTSGVTFSSPIGQIESIIQSVAPGVETDLSQVVRESARWLAASIGTVFAGTATTLFYLLIAFVGLYYLFRDGESLVRHLIHLSPLGDTQDEYIIEKLSAAIRSVVTGTLLIGIIQGTLTAIGFSIFGIPHAVLWGTVAAIAALIPTVGTAVVFVPSIIFLAATGSLMPAIGLGIWGALAVGLIDNILGPHLMSRGNATHPYFILIAALGGIAVFGPIGFILGPIIISFFTTLIEVYRMTTIRKTNP